MKLTNLFLASTAIPLMMLSANASALQQQNPAPITVAQADTGDQPQQPPKARQRAQGQDEQAPPGQQRRERRQGADEEGGRPQRPQRGAQGSESPDTPRAPRAASPDQEAPATPRRSQEQRSQEQRSQEQRSQEQRPQQQRQQEQRQPAEKPAPAQPSQAPAERSQTQSQDRKEAPARPQRPDAQERDQRPGDRQRPQAPDSSERPASPSTTAPAPQRRDATPAPRPGDEQRQEQDQRRNPDQRRDQDRSRTEPAPSTPPRTAPTPAPTAPAPTAPAPRPQPAPPAPAQPAPAPRAQPTPPPAPNAQQQTSPQQAQPLDPSRVRIDDLRRQRRERREGDRVIIEEPGDRTIIREGNSVIIRHDETERFRRIYGADEVRVERRGPGEETTIVRRPDGSEIVTVRDEYGNLVRRIRREPAGREVILIDNRRSGIGARPGYGYVEEDVLRMPPPRVSIPRDEYIVETERASPAQIVEAFTAPPVQRIDRAYTLDEVRRSQPLRERMRRVDLDTINFEFGSWELPPDQIDALGVIADGLRQAISRNPNEIFMIEGHTDAVGSDEDNLTLSDRRAETVATILSQRFQIPAENLTTQGYGEQYLKVNTQGPERENRRVTLRRITPLLQGQNQQ
ncbi:OmpA family protein [Microvirga sp. M2]|uniref:OmpA family protein n=1 Tax=Microvirga sp. M2 TaxID=3073270 RepID=UPI0039C35445